MSSSAIFVMFRKGFESKKVKKHIGDFFISERNYQILAMYLLFLFCPVSGHSAFEHNMVS